MTGDETETEEGGSTDPKEDSIGAAADVSGRKRRTLGKTFEGGLDGPQVLTCKS